MTGTLLFVGKIIVFTISFLFVANIPDYVNAQRIGIYPYQFYVGAIGTLLLFAVITKTIIKIPKANFSIILWFSALVLVCLASLLFISNNGLAQNELNRIGMFAGIGASLALILSNEELIPACGYGVLCAVGLCTVLTFMEFFDPNFNVMVDVIFDSKAKDGVVQRNGGLHGNPNANGYALTLGMFVAQYFLPKSLRFVFALLVGFAVFTTVSRSAILLWVIVIFYGLWVGNYLGKSVLSKFVAALAIGALYLSLSTGQLPGFLQSVGLDEYMNQNMMDRLSGDFFSQGDQSAEGRLAAATLAAEMFIDNPVFGAGLGTARGSHEVFGEIGAHNMVARLGAELGIVGVLIYLTLLLVPLVANSKVGMVFVFFYFFLNMFTHTSFEKPVFAILIPMAILYFSVVHSKKQRRRRRRRSKTSAGSDNFQQVSA